MLAAAAAATIAAVYWYGAGRAARLEQFARRHDGEVSPHDAFDLRDRLADLYAEEVHVGYSARLETDGDAPVSLYLYELHPEPQGRARSTAVSMIVERPSPDTTTTIRARLPSAETERPFADRFAVEGIEPDQVPAPLAELLEKRVDQLDWLPEVRLADGRLVVGSRERVLANENEWRELLELANEVRRALENLG